MSLEVAKNPGDLFWGVPILCMSFSLNSLKGVLEGIIWGTYTVTKGDTRSLDYSSHVGIYSCSICMEALRFPGVVPDLSR